MKIDYFASITICINLKLIISEDFGTLHFSSTIEANLAIAKFLAHFSIFRMGRALIVPQNCYAPKSSSIISFQLNISKVVSFWDTLEKAPAPLSLCQYLPVCAMYRYNLADDDLVKE